MFNDKYLKFASKEEADSVLYTVTPAVLDEENNLLKDDTLTPRFMNIDVIGTIYERFPVPTPEDYVPVAMDGWHVNVRLLDGEDGSDLDNYVVVPTQLRRVWA